MTLLFIEEKEVNNCKIGVYESEYYQLQITTDLETGYVNSAVKSLIRSPFLPLITVSKLDGEYSVDISTSGRGGLTVEDGKEIIKFMRAAIDTVMDINKILEI